MFDDIAEIRDRGGNAPIVVKYETEDISEHRARVVE